MIKVPVSDAELRHQLSRARRRGRETLRSPTRIVAAHYDDGSQLMEAQFANGFRIAFPAALIDGLERATPSQLRAFEIDAGGEALIWPELDADVAVLGLLVQCFGRSPFFAELGRAGGRSKSEAKARAARANGRKGGRPRRSPSGRG